MLQEGPTSWDEVLIRWKARGPMNHQYVTRLQRGYRERMAAG
jgi:ring-1,2-phenylacetyl-CoA epoxidase subunit PaaA